MNGYENKKIVKIRIIEEVLWIQFFCRIGWLAVLRIYVALAVFQPFLD